MSTTTTPGTTTKSPALYTGMRYNDAPAAIEWLGKAFGFVSQFVVPGPNGTIAHAQLTLGDALIMIGTGRPDGVMSVPKDIGAVTQSLYFCVDDLDSYYARAMAAGAEVVIDLHDTEYGSREFTVRDPEGHVWGFGTYDPKAAG
jgi:uncharacterized glyoxalase superfamily protein PhnB